LVFDLIDNSQNVLILAGDTHGGQIPLPSWLWRILGYEKNARYEQGWFESGMKKMYVTRGVGSSHFPFRFFRRPEVTVFHFQAKGGH
jgi:predicted MPP superfamily phosphohydrolase